MNQRERSIQDIKNEILRLKLMAAELATVAHDLDEKLMAVSAPSNLVIVADTPHPEAMRAVDGQDGSLSRRFRP